MEIGTSGPQNKDIKRSTLESGGQSSRSHKAEYRFAGLVEASFSTPVSLSAYQYLLFLHLTLYRHVKTAQQRAIIQQHGDWHTGR